MLAIVVPGAFYLGSEGITVSRIVYGEKWIAADPLIWPGALAGLGMSMFAIGSNILLAANRLRVCVYLDILVAGLSAPLVMVAWWTHDLYPYAWLIALTQIGAGAIALQAASSLLVKNWIGVAVVPPVVCSVLAWACVFVIKHVGADLSLPAELCISSAVYAAVLIVSFRVLFPKLLGSALIRMPGGIRMRCWLKLSSPSIEAT
jgi:O-antigen/teichoic acid export membrane protein